MITLTEQAYRTMTTQAPPLRSMLEQLIATLSVSSVTPTLDHGNRALIALLADWLASAGFRVEILPVPGRAEKFNLVGTLGRGTEEIGRASCRERV